MKDTLGIMNQRINKFKEFNMKPNHQMQKKVIQINKTTKVEIQKNMT